MVENDNMIGDHEYVPFNVFSFLIIILKSFPYDKLHFTIHFRLHLE